MPPRTIEYPRVRTLVCLAGPPAVGKTNLMRAARNGDGSRLSKIIGTGDLTGTPSFAAGWVPRGTSDSPLAIFHYDFLRVWKFGGAGLSVAKDPGAVPILHAENLVVVTLVADLRVLRDRFRARPPMRGESWLVGLKRPRVLAGEYVGRFRTTRLYRDPDLLLELYGEWIQFVESLNPSAHFFVDCTDEVREVSFQVWSNSIRSRYLRATPSGVTDAKLST